MAEKLVSVCINSYNSGKYILETINSVINQSYKNLQIIVIDDCSTDNTVELIKSINDSRIEIHSTYKNSYITFAYNESLKYVKGDYIARLDADDLWQKDKIEKQVNFLEQNQEYGACFTHVQVINEAGETDDESLQFLRDIFAFENCSQAEMYRQFYDNSNRLCHSSSLIRTTVMNAVGDYDVSTFNVHDFDYWMRLLTYCPIYIITEPLTLYRSGGASGNMTKEKAIAQNTEIARATYKSINMCPDDLFLEAFRDKLKLSGEHTHEETEIEKALLLLEGPLTYIGNPVLGLYKFAELFKEEKNIIIADKKFNFTTKDFYKMQGHPAYFNVGDNEHLVNSLAKFKNEFENECKINLNLSNELHNCKTYINDLENQREQNVSHIKNVESYVKQLEGKAKSLEHYSKSLEDSNVALNEQLTNVTSSYNNIINSRFWKLTKPLRFCLSKLKQL